VDGAPDAVLQGGRYDALIGRYGRARPAVGFAIDVEAAAGALEAKDASGAGETKIDGGVLVAGPQAEAARKASELRARGERVALVPSTLPRAEVDAYARRWGFARVVHAGASPQRKGKARR
jgi:ATP phosphoribosyltransferase regulatory subunit